MCRLTADSASKHALHGYFDSLRCELAPHGVRVTLFCPGYIKTQLSANALTGGGEQYGGNPVSTHLLGVDVLSVSAVTDGTTARGMSAEYAARQLMQCIAVGGRSLVLATPTHHLALYFSFFWPSLLDWILQQRQKIT